MMCLVAKVSRSLPSPVLPWTGQHFERLLAVLFAGLAWFVLPHTSLVIASQVNDVGGSKQSQA